MAQRYELDTDFNILKRYICPDVIENSQDTLRSELGNVWIYSADAHIPGVRPVYHLVDLLPIVLEDAGDTTRGIPIWTLYSTSKYILKLEVNPVLVSAINDRTLVPNYKIPMRAYSNPETTKGDKFWNEFFSGGSFGSEEFSNLMNSQVYYDDSFMMPLPYSRMQAKLLGRQNENMNEYQVTCHYNNYNESIQIFKDWSAERSSELLIPSIYSLYSTQTFWAHWAMAPSGPDAIFTDKAKVLSQVRTLPEIYRQDILYNILPTIYADDNGYPNEYDEWCGAYAYHIHSASTEDSIIKTYKNIFFNEENDTNEYSLYTINNMPSYERKNPYEISIKFPKHNAELNYGDRAGLGRLPTVNATYTTAEEHPVMNDISPIRSIIENSGLSAKFLETLKDFEDGAWPGMEYIDKPFLIETFMHPDMADLLNAETVTETQIKSFDLLEFVSTLYNHHDAAVNENYIFQDLAGFRQRVAWYDEGGPPPGTPRTYLSGETSYSDDTLYRYKDSVKIIETIERLFDYLQSYMQVGITPASGRAGTDAVGAVGTESYEDFLSEYTDDAENILNYLMVPRIRIGEVIAYKIEKNTANESIGDVNTQINLQNFWFWNSSTNIDSHPPSDFIEYKDTQVKYGTEYTYDCYAYLAITGHKYKYSDFRLTKQIGTIDEDQDGNPEYYCLEFYDPKTMERADQIFTIDYSGLYSGPPSALGDVRETESQYPQFSALSQRNEYATKQQDLSRSPQVADFHLNIEPYIKILKIPMFSKTLGVYDNPGNTVTSIPFQFLDSSKRIGFNAAYDDFAARPYPQIISSEDRDLRTKYLHAKDLLSTDNIAVFSESPARYIEMYRITKKPTAYQDFENYLVSRIDLKIKDSFLNYSDHILSDKIQTNKKYYYMFRFVTENGMPGALSQILECELVDDGGYIYSLFELFEESQFAEASIVKPSTSFKKIIQLEPNISQIVLDDSEVDYSKPAATQVDNLRVGPSENRLFDKRFKIRLTSKKTGKKLDINVSFNVQTENFTMTPIGEV